MPRIPDEKRFLSTGPVVCVDGKRLRLVTRTPLNGEYAWDGEIVTLERLPDGSPNRTIVVRYGPGYTVEAEGAER